MNRVWRFDGTVTCDVSVWIEATTQEEAQQKFAAASESDLNTGTSLRHIHPIKDTAVISSIRESTEENP